MKLEIMCFFRSSALWLRGYKLMKTILLLLSPILLSFNSAFAEQTSTLNNADKDPIYSRKTKAIKNLKHDANSEDTEVGIDTSDHVLLGYGSFRFGGAFASPYSGYLFGVNGAAIVNETYGFGVDFDTFANDSLYSPSKEPWSLVKVSSISRGLMFEYYHQSNKLTHSVYSIVMGQAVISAELKDAPPFSDVVVKRFFFIEPRYLYEFNTTKYMRMGIGAGAKLVFGGKVDADINASNFNAITLNVQLKIGSFRL